MTTLAPLASAGAPVLSPLQVRDAYQIAQVMSADTIAWTLEHLRGRHAWRPMHAVVTAKYEHALRIATGRLEGPVLGVRCRFCDSLSCFAAHRVHATGEEPVDLEVGEDCVDDAVAWVETTALGRTSKVRVDELDADDYRRHGIELAHEPSDWDTAVDTLPTVDDVDGFAAAIAGAA